MPLGDLSGKKEFDDALDRLSFEYAANLLEGKMSPEEAQRIFREKADALWDGFWKRVTALTDEPE